MFFCYNPNRVVCFIYELVIKFYNIQLEGQKFVLTRLFECTSGVSDHAVVNNVVYIIVISFLVQYPLCFVQFSICLVSCQISSTLQYYVLDDNTRCIRFPKYIPVYIDILVDLMLVLIILYQWYVRKLAVFLKQVVG